jgi:hypothetical protein
MDTKTIFGTMQAWVKGIVDLLAGLLAMGVLTELTFGTGFFGASVIGNLTGLVATIGSAGFAGVVALLILVGLFNHKG